MLEMLLVQNMTQKSTDSVYFYTRQWRPTTSLNLLWSMAMNLGGVWLMVNEPGQWESEPQSHA